MKIWLPALTVLLLASACGGGGGNPAPPSNSGDEYTLIVPSGATERTENKILLNAKDPSKVKSVDFKISIYAPGINTSEIVQSDNSAPYEISLNNIPAGNVSVVASINEHSGRIQSRSAPFIVSQARTEINGDVKSDTTWTKENSPYVIKEPIYIEENAHLNIQPGVIIRGGDIRNYGTITAKGTSNDPIILDAYLAAVSADLPGPAIATFSHSVIKTGFLFGDYNERGTLTIEDSIIEPRSYGLTVYPNTNINLYRNRIKKTGILIYGGSRNENYITIKNNLFEESSNGVGLNFTFGRIQAEITGNTFVIPENGRAIFSASGDGGLVDKQDYFIKGNYFQGLGDRDIEDFIYDNEDRRENKINLEVVDNLTEPAAPTPKN